MRYLILLLLSGCATTTESLTQTALNLTKEHFSNTATIKDDALDTTATITTFNGFQEKRGLLGVVWEDDFLRAFVDKKSGKTLIQVYQKLSYRGSGWHFFNTVNYETPTGPQSAQLTIIKRDVDCSGSRYLGCTYTEQVGFNVDESLFRTIAGKYAPGKLAGWKYKLSAKSGQDYQGTILASEIAGFMEKLDGYRSAKGFVKTHETSPTAGNPPNGKGL